MNFKKNNSRNSGFKRISSFCILFFTCFSLFALPGIKREIEDSSGEYVYYRDYSFERVAYVGFLFYDENTYQIRYYAPSDSEKKLPEKEISFYVTVDSESDYWNMTGEEVVSTIMPDTDDVTILNYLHDLLYEFSARRIKAGTVVSLDKNEISQDFVQFGGNVKIKFDNTVPVFNIKSIVDFENKSLFECCTTGKIYSSNDVSFNKFVGFTEQTTAKKTQKIKSKKIVKFAFNEKQEVSLDENWLQQTENSWTFGDESFLVLLELPHQYKDKNNDLCSLIRRMTESVDGMYSDFQNMVIVEEENGYKVTIDSCVIAKKNYIHSVYKFTKQDNSNVLVLSMSTYYDQYCKDKSYYDKIVKSYKTN